MHSVGFITKQWDTFSADLVFQRIENFQTTNKGDSIVIRKLPEFDFSSRDREISSAVIPIWVSFDSSAGLVKRSQPLFVQTQQFVDRVDAAAYNYGIFLGGFSPHPQLGARNALWRATVPEILLTRV